jgi:hypothetical protein
VWDSASSFGLIAALVQIERAAVDLAEQLLEQELQGDDPSPSQDFLAA